MHTPGPEHDDSFDFLFKIILIGDSNVGKTCVVQNFKSGMFSEKQQNTIGVDFSVRTLDIEGKKVKVSTICRECVCSGACVCWGGDKNIKCRTFCATSCSGFRVHFFKQLEQESLRICNRHVTVDWSKDLTLQGDKRIAGCVKTEISRF